MAKNTPQKVKTVPIDVVEGLTPAMAKDIAKFLEFDSKSLDQV